MAQTPDPKKVREAIAQTKADSSAADGRVLKVLYLDDAGEKVGEWASSQLPENPWDGLNEKNLIEPPYSMPQLTFLAEMHPVHSSALDQKTADITGKGWTWEADDSDHADDALLKEMTDWFESLAPDEYDMREVIASAWLDVETVGWGLLECARDPQGVIRRVYQVPAHTVKAHKNGFSLCQARDSRKVWFRRWGATDALNKRVDVDAKSGRAGLDIPNDRKANDLFVIKKPSRRSSWYGIPGYVSSMGWITLALAARDDNLYFFANRREPRWAIVLTGMSEDTEIEEDLRRAFTVDLKQPYRNIMVPVAGKDAKVTFQQLSDTQKDGSFGSLSDRADKAIMISHRVPGERLANTTVGALGGNIASEANAVYKEGVVEPSQEILNARLRKFVQVEFPKFKGDKTPAKPGEKSPWLITMQGLDTRSEREDLDQSVLAFHGNITILREARHKAGYGPLMVKKKVPKVDPLTGEAMLDPTGQPILDVPTNEQGDPIDAELVESSYNDMLFTELPGAQAQAGQPGAVPTGIGGLAGELKKARNIEAEVRELLRQSRETHERLVNATNDD